ncbi:hypothetical protein ACOSP7_024281 [Xanthoceras sorbifolium]
MGLTFEMGSFVRDYISLKHIWDIIMMEKLEKMFVLGEKFHQAAPISWNGELREIQSNGDLMDLLAKFEEKKVKQIHFIVEYLPLNVIHPKPNHELNPEPNIEQGLKPNPELVLEPNPEPNHEPNLKTNNHPNPQPHNSPNIKPNNPQLNNQSTSPSNEPNQPTSLSCVKLSIICDNPDTNCNIPDFG